VAGKNGGAVDTLVKVVEQGGRSSQKEVTSDIVHFCDLGIGRVRVEVRSSSASCSWVFADYVEVDWSRERIINIVVPNQVCSFELVDSLGPCRVAFRVEDEDNAWVSGAVIAVTSPSSREMVADRFGRVLFESDSAGEVSGVVSAPGYVPLRFSFPCRTFIERGITLVWNRRP